MKNLYVTTFNSKLYTQSGKDLLTSFLKYIENGDMLVCYEGFDFKSDFESNDRIFDYNMEQDEYMCNWITANEDNIPEIYGGKAGDDHPIVKQFNDKEGQYWANHRASRYFRKVVALNYALTHYQNEYDYIFVIDCDCIFKNNIMDDKITDELFIDDAAMIYFWSKHRKRIGRGPETGFTGYCKSNRGFEFAKKICDCYSSQDFLRFEFWDDGYVIGRLINENDQPFVLYDLVGQSKHRTTRVMEIPENPLFGIVHHFKNRHQVSY